jgi:hypothetical protein
MESARLLSVVLSFLYRLVHRTFGLLGLAGRDTFAKDAEILVLRHQVAVLRRQVGRARFTWSDRALIALLAGLIPRERWTAFLVTPKTILDWHRRLVARRWTYPHRRSGQPSRERETVDLIVRFARKIPGGDTYALSENYESSASPCPRRASPPCSLDTGFSQHHGGRDRPGRSSCPLRPRGSWRPTSFTSTR